MSIRVNCPVKRNSADFMLSVNLKKRRIRQSEQRNGKFGHEYENIECLVSTRIAKGL